jgi:CRP/FNR family transcriptional regulator, cyclic AMP receptor protein
MPRPETQPAAFMRALSGDERAAFETLGRTRRLRRGEPVFYEGDDPGGVIAIVSGRIKVSVIGAGGREVVLRFCGPGELVGEISAITRHPRSATAKAAETVEVIAVRAADFRRFVAEHPRVAPLVFDHLAAALAEADRQRVDFATRDVTARVASRLLELAREGDEEGLQGVRITLPLSQEELAAWTGASREAVARSLHLLRELGWVQTGRREIKVLNLSGLKSLAD